MPAPTFFENIKDKLVSSFSNMWDGAVEFIPKIAVAILLFLVGWIIAKVLYKMIKKALEKVKIDSLAEKLEIDVVMSKINPDLTLSGLIAKLIYYVVIVVFLISVSDILGLDTMKSAIFAVLSQAPTFMIALIIFIFGYYVSKMIHKAVYTATNSMGVSGAKIIANIVFYIIMIFISITALQQAGMNTDLISNNVTLIIGSILFAFAISYGIAARGIVANMLSSYYGKGKFKEGQKIKVLDTEGVILKVDSISVTLSTGRSKIVLPSKMLLENTVEIIDDNETVNE